MVRLQPWHIARTPAVIYARVSSKEQEKEGFSIPVQLKLLKEYAAAEGLPFLTTMLTWRRPSRADVLVSTRWSHSSAKIPACAPSWSRRRTVSTEISKTGSRL